MLDILGSWVYHTDGTAAVKRYRRLQQFEVSDGFTCFWTQYVDAPRFRSSAV